MICCDGCEEWFHGKCVGITMEQGKIMEKQGREYVCDKCRGIVSQFSYGCFSYKRSTVSQCLFTGSMAAERSIIAGTITLVIDR